MLLSNVELVGVLASIFAVVVRCLSMNKWLVWNAWMLRQIASNIDAHLSSHNWKLYNQ